MAKFYLIDHSLKTIGGHHYEYARQMLDAAERAGFTPILAANRKFNRATELPPRWKIATPFHFSSYSKHALIGGLPRWLGNEPPPIDSQSWWSRQKKRLGKFSWQVGEWRRLIRGDARSRSFHRGLMKLFAQIPLEEGDHVLIGTLNELDVIGAQRYWRSRSDSALADWHMHFHYPVEADWKADPTLSRYHLGRLGDLLGSCAADFPNHRLHLFTTTDPLAEQYVRVTSAPVCELPYPVNADFFHAKVPHRPGEPLRVTSAGGVREEKGVGLLSTLLDGVWSDYFLTGQARLVMQAESVGKLPEKLRVYWNETTATREEQLARGVEQPFSPMELLPSPLSTSDYRKLILGCDIGLLLYDRKFYQARCSGVLAEMLSAGIPVIVPAGCWLADQVARPIYEHLESVARDRKSILGDRLNEVGPSEFEKLTNGTGASYSTNDLGRSFFVRLRWKSETQRNEYLRVELRPYDRSGRRLPPLVEVLSPGKQGEYSSALFSLSDEIATFDLHCESAYNDVGVRVTHGEFKLMADALDEKSVPWGAVGLIVSDERQMPKLLANMIEHYGHFERTATKFVDHWATPHHPDRIIKQLRQSGGDSANSARTLPFRLGAVA